MEGSSHHPLHLRHVHKRTIIINRLHNLLHFTFICFLIYYRISFFLQAKTKLTSLFPHLLLFFSELLLSLMWLLRQASRWRPVSRTVFPDRLPGDDKLPGIDVFICTADPNKEPTVEVMNTVLSAMALDYPPEKLNVYVSDDGGSLVTLLGMREARKFGKWWVPFCKKYGIKTICPEAYFSRSEEADEHDGFMGNGNDQFLIEKQKIKGKYELFKERIIYIKDNNDVKTSRDHPAHIEIIGENEAREEEEEESWVKMPQLVYVCREKKPSHPHHFKAGAINVLLRVSGVLSNSPYILVLDCDMYCNDPSSARQAMCFNFDSKISASLAFVQFPQRFRNISKDDIYDSQVRSIFWLQWYGMDGLNGPILSGTNFYIKRDALYDKNAINADCDLKELENTFGSSKMFLMNSFQVNYKSRIDHSENSKSTLLQEAKVLASCAIKNNTEWGQKVGFLYHSLAEDYFTGYTLHCKGWKSVYINPSRPQFLGTSTTSLNDIMIQGCRWMQGVVQVGISRFCPLIYGPLKMSLLQSMIYAEIALFPLLDGLSMLCFAIIPQICLLNSIDLYPKVSSPFFNIFFFIFLSSHARHLYEVLSTGGSIKIWKNEQRIFMMKSVTTYLYGSLYVFMEKLGLREAIFLPTDKVDDDEKTKLYQMGIFDFRTSIMFLAPMVTIIILNATSFVGGLFKIIFMKDDWEKMFSQIFISFYILITNYTIIEGMLVRTDKARIPIYVVLLSTVLSIIFLSLGSFIFQN